MKKDVGEFEIIVWDIEMENLIKRLNVYDDKEKDDFSLNIACDFEFTNDGKLICLFVDKGGYTICEYTSRIKIFDTLDHYECVNTLKFDHVVNKIKLHSHYALAVYMNGIEYNLIEIFSITTGEYLKRHVMDFFMALENFAFCSDFDLKDA